MNDLMPLRRLAVRGLLVALVGIVGVGPAAVPAWAETLVVEVVDHATGEPVGNVLVIVQGRAAGSRSGADGRVVFEDLKPGAHLVRVYSDAYQLRDWDRVDLASGTGSTHVVHLTPRVYQLPGVTIQAPRMRFRWEDTVTPYSYVENDRDRILRVPGSFQDPFRSLQVLPGVSAVNDLAGLVRVRGGTPDQNLYLVDGIGLHNPYRMRILFGGGISMFNIDLVDDIRLQAGGFSARYGNRLASVIEVTTREGSRQETAVRTSASLISANVLVEGPWRSGRGSWIVSARRTYYDVAVRGAVDPGTTLPNFYDFQLKSVHDLDETRQVIFEGLYGREKTDVTSSDLFTFGGESVTAAESESSLGAVIYRQRPSDDSVLELRASYLHDENTVRVTDDVLRVGDLSTRDYGSSFRGEFARTAGARDFRFGMEMNWSHYDLFWARDPGAPNLHFPTPTESVASGRKSHNGLYAEMTQHLGEDALVTAGVRGDETTINDDREVSPRLSVTWRPAAPVILELAGGLFYQAPEPSLVFAREHGYDFGTDLRTLDSERAAHVNASLRWRRGPSVGLRVEGFYRDLDQVLVPADQRNRASSDGEGFTSGAELLVERNPGGNRRWSGFVSYSYTHARVRGGTYTDWTRPAGHAYHTLSASGTLNLGHSWSLSNLASFKTGGAYSVPELRIREVLPDGTESWIAVYEPANRHEWPEYFRWDVRLEHHRQLFSRRVTFFLEMINVTDRDNVVGILWDADYSSSEVLRMLPRIPSFGFSVDL